MLKIPGSRPTTLAVTFISPIYIYIYIYIYAMDNIADPDPGILIR